MATKQPRDLSGLISLKEEKDRHAAAPVPAPPVAHAEERKPAMFRVRPQAKKQFAILARELDRTEQDLIAEAMNLVFDKYGKPRID